MCTAACTGPKYIECHYPHASGSARIVVCITAVLWDSVGMIVQALTKLSINS